MKKLLIFLFIIAFVSSHAEHLINKSDLRKKFYLSVENSKLAKEYILELNNLKTNKNPLVNGYLAATNMVMAGHAFNPYSKFKYFIDGKKQLEETIKVFPNDIELRVIRFAIQTNAPSFLGYTNEINTDKAFLLKNFHKLESGDEKDEELKGIILEYLKKSKLCSKEELEILFKS